MTSKRGGGQAFVPDRELEAKMASMTLEEQLSEVLMSPWRRRFELILSSERAADLVRSLPSQELFWTVKAAGPEASLHVLELAAPEQLQFFFDLDWWDRDQLVPEKILSWFLVLFELGKDANLGWIRWVAERDEWLLPTILAPFIRVEKRPDDMDIQEARDLLPPFTLEDVYFIAFRNEKIAPALAMFLMNLFEASAALYRDVMETMLWNTPSENREKALRLRRSRLNDRGLNDYHDSLEILAPIAPENMHPVAGGGRHYARAVDQLPLPAFVPTLYLQKAPAVHRAVERLSGLGSQEMPRIVYEMVGAVNKIIMADRVDFDQEESMALAVERAFGFLNIGIETMASREAIEEHEVLERYHVEELVRLGVTAVRKLVERAGALERSPAFAFLPELERETVLGLRAVPAMFYDPADGRRPFVQAGELGQALERLLRAEAMCLAAGVVEPSPEEWRQACDWTSTNVVSPEEIEIPEALSTSLANCLLGRGLVLEPLEPGDIMDLARAIESDEFASRLQEVERAFAQAGLGRPQALVQELVSRIRDVVEEASVSESDPRFISGLYLSTSTH